MASEEKRQQSKDDGTIGARLVDDVKRLLMYCVEQGRLPDIVDASVVHDADAATKQGAELDKDTFKTLTDYYQAMERQFENVTPSSLRATEPREPGRIRSSDVGRYLMRLWIIAAAIVVAVLTSNIVGYLHEVHMPPPGEEWEGWLEAMDIGYQVSVYLEPFLYGALGAIVFLLRVSERRLRSREFDPARVPEHINRVVLGTLSGGAIILLIEQVPGEGGTAIQISAAALGFLAGYSIDFLFETVDRTIQAILPKVGLETVRTQARQRRFDELLRQYRSQLGETKDEAEKKVLSRVIEDLDFR